MKTRVLLFSILFSFSAVLPAFAQEEAAPFMGRWALHLPGGAGWLEVHDRHGFVDAALLWYGGSVLPVSGINITSGVLTVTRTMPVTRMAADGTERKLTIANRLEMKQQDGMLRGTGYFPERDGFGQRVVEFTGDRIPDLPPAPDMSAIEFGEPVVLFNGMDLTGWSLTNSDQTNGFMVEDGVLINNPVQQGDGHRVSYGNLRTDRTFEDFNLKVEVNIPPGSNSGIYLRGIYEIQVADTYGKPLDSHNMGALYSRIVPAAAAEKPGGEWQSFDITLYRQHLTVVLNGTVIIANQPVLGVTGGALTADESKPGPIYLQGDHGRVLYRNMVLTPIVH